MTIIPTTLGISAALPLMLLLMLLLSSCKRAEAAEQQPHRNLRARIVGGSPAQKGRHPYFAQWQGAKCGATVIWEDILISAAHCYDEFNPPANRNVLLNSTQRDAGIPRRYVEVVPHPQYSDAANENEKDFDVVLIKTAVSMLKNNDGTPTGVEVLPLNRNPALPEVDDALMAVGFGQTSENNPTLSNELRDVIIYYVDDDFCSEQYPFGGFNKNLMFCAAVPGGRKDTCQGMFKGVGSDLFVCLFVEFSEKGRSS